MTTTYILYFVAAAGFAAWYLLDAYLKGRIPFTKRRAKAVQARQRRATQNAEYQAKKAEQQRMTAALDAEILGKFLPEGASRHWLVSEEAFVELLTFLKGKSYGNCDSFCFHDFRWPTDLGGQVAFEYAIVGAESAHAAPTGEVLDALRARRDALPRPEGRWTGRGRNRRWEEWSEEDPRHSARRGERRYSEREIVYVLERVTSEGRFFKIGKTSRNDVSRRAYECRSNIVAYTNEVRERDVHRELRHSRVSRDRLPAEITNSHGPTEWFRPTPEVERFAFDGVLPSGRTARMVADRAA